MLWPMATARIRTTSDTSKYYHIRILPILNLISYYKLNKFNVKAKPTNCANDPINPTLMVAVSFIFIPRFLTFQVPPISAIANVSVKSESISSGSTISTTSHHHQSAKVNGFEQYYSAAASPIVSETVSPPSSPSSRSPSPVIPSGRSTSYPLPDITSGCSRTVPISWTSSGSTSATSFLHVCTYSV